MFSVDAVIAQPARYEARRHFDSQGIEVIQNRTSESEKKTDSSRSEPKGGKTSVGKAPAPAAASGPAQTTKIPVKQQLDRDLERLEILKQELQTEELLYQRNVALLQAPNIKAMLSEHELQRLNYTLSLHEQNVKSLQAEIRRAEGLLR